MKKILLFKHLIFLYFFLNAAAHAETKLICNTETHVKHYEFISEQAKEMFKDTIYNQWMDLTPRVREITIKKNSIITHDDSSKKLGIGPTNYKIITNDLRYLVGQNFERAEDGITVQNLIYDKMFKFISITYYSDYGVSVYDGYCN